MTKLYFGGSFNPIHVGHLLVARAVAEARGFNRVVLLPSASPPHKGQATDIAAPAHRLKMCQLVAAADTLFEAGDLEIHRGGASFTIDTVRQLKAQGASQVHWLIGADMLAILPNWRSANELLGEITFWIARRPGFEIDWSALGPDYQFLKEQIVDAPLIEISASQIRQRVGQKRPIQYLTPPTVESYIFEEGLYQAG